MGFHPIHTTPMTQTLKELMAERAQLEAAIAAARQSESATALSRVHELVSEFGFTMQQIFPLTPAKKQGEPKYRDDETGATWTGRGKPPTWILGKNREDFLIEQAPSEQGPFLAEMAAAAANRRM